MQLGGKLRGADTPEVIVRERRSNGIQEDPFTAFSVCDLPDLNRGCLRRITDRQNG